MMRSAISPRFATRIRLYIKPPVFSRKAQDPHGRQLPKQWESLLVGIDFEQRLPEFHWLAVVDQHGHDLARDFGRNLVEDLHGLNDANRGGWADMIAHFHE